MNFLRVFYAIAHFLGEAFHRPGDRDCPAGVVAIAFCLVFYPNAGLFRLPSMAVRRIPDLGPILAPPCDDLGMNHALVWSSDNILARAMAD